jgi:hypothetical protein
MCAKCEEQAESILKSPEKTDRFARAVADDALHMAAAMVAAGMKYAQENRMGAHIGSFAIHAACAALAQRFAETFGPETTKVVVQIREHALERLVVALDVDPSNPGARMVTADLSPERH